MAKRAQEEATALPHIEESLVGAFCQEFSPTPYEFDADVIFDTGALRDFFNCWRAFGDSSPDLLPAYMEKLSEVGYHRIVGSGGTPVIPVRRKLQQHLTSAEEIED